MILSGQPQPLRRYLPIALLVCLFAIVGIGAGVAFAGANAGAVKQAATSAGAANAPEVTATPTPCPAGWSVVASPNPGLLYNYLYGVAAVSAGDVWAVGYYADTGMYQTLVEHWDGTAWTMVPSLSPGTSNNYLNAVAAVSANDVWAVGSYNNGGWDQTLVEHWDGTAWAVITSPNQPSAVNSFWSVSAISSNNVWAVGGYDPGTVSQTLVEHWDGSTWTIVPSPNQGSSGNFLNSVAVVSASDIWAVGYGGAQTLVEHWDGTAWTIVPSPSPGSTSNYLYGVAAVSANDVWAVGFYTGPGAPQTLTEHWNGSAWSVVLSPSPGSLANYLDSVTAVSANDVWAVGYFEGGLTLVEHWDGSTWTIVPSPNPGPNTNQFYGVAAVSAGDVWAVGRKNNSDNNYETLVEHYLNPCSPSPSPTPVATSTATNTPPAATSTPTNSATRTTTVTSTPTVCGTGIWTIGGDYPIPIQRAAIAFQAGSLYSFGGNSTSGPPVSNAYRYDPGTNGWASIAPLPAALTGASAVSDGTYIYILNGATSSNLVNTLYRYDPMANTYTTLAPSPVATWLQSAIYLNGNIYRITGCTIEETGCQVSLSSVDLYSIGSNTWSPAGTVADYPISEGFLAVATDGTYIYGAGGGTIGSTTEKTYRYDPAANVWDDAAVADLPFPAQYSAYGVAGQRWILVQPGWLGATISLDLTNPSQPWVDSPSMPIGRVAATGAGGGSMLYVVGGYGVDNQPTRDTQKYQQFICATPTSTIASATATAPISTHTSTPPPAVTASPMSSTTPVTPSRTSTSIVASATPTILASPTSCSIQFTDVPPGSTFYPYIHCLACRGIINGYADGTFKPNNDVTRGQLSKIVSNAASFSDPQPTQMFQDVPVGSTFQVYIGRLASRGYINGYACGGTGEPCLPPANLPYFRPNNNATRGQISKIVSNAALFGDPPSGQQFEDVPAGSAFYTYTYRLVSRGVMSGYACGGVGEPCVPPGNLPYFRPNNNATRGQTSKIVGNTFFPDCQIP